MTTATSGTTTYESRMLIDGKLVEASSGRSFDNINPATEEPVGQVADASKAEIRRAIDAARRAFDETNWSTDRAFRKHCLEQLQEALEAEREGLREELILEVGCPRMTTQGPQLDGPLDGALRYPAKLIDEFAWETQLPDGPGQQGEPNTRHGPGASPPESGVLGTKGAGSLVVTLRPA